jgi:hypothetical protein
VRAVNTVARAFPGTPTPASPAPEADRRRAIGAATAEDSMFQVTLVSVPSWLLGLLIVGGVALLALLGLSAVRRAVPREVRAANNDVAGFLIAVVGALYAVMLALVVVVVWEQFESARGIAQREANAVADLYRGAGGFADADRVRLRDGLKAYALAVTDDEWPVLARGRASDRAWQEFDALWRDYLALNPQTEREAALYDGSLDQLVELGNARRERLLASRTTIPGVLWLALIVGGGITIGFSYFFGVGDERAHTLMTLALAGVIGLGLFAIVAMDLPYTGDVSISPEAFRQTLEIMERLERR